MLPQIPRPDSDSTPELQLESLNIGGSTRDVEFEPADGEESPHLRRPSFLPPVLHGTFRTQSMIDKEQQSLGKNGGSRIDSAFESNTVVPADSKLPADSNKKLPRLMFIIAYLAAGLLYIECVIVVFLHTFNMGSGTKQAWLFAFGFAVIIEFVIIQPCIIMIISFVQIHSRLTQASMT